MTLKFPSADLAGRPSMWRRPQVFVIAALAAAMLGACSQDPGVKKQRLLESGDAYVKEGKLQEAVIEYRSALQVDARFADARLRLAETYAKLGEPARALEEYVRAADLLPDDAEVQLTAGQYLLAARDAQSALARADKVIEKDPQNVRAHVLRGSALGGLNELDRALDEMEQAVQLDPSRGATYAQLGVLEQARGRQQEAEAALRKALELEPKWITGHLALGNFYWSTNRREQAQQAFERALALDPKHANAHRAMALLLMATGRAGEAEAHLKEVAASSRSGAGVFALADYYLATKRPDDAVAVLQPLAEKSGMAEPKHRLAIALAVAGERDKAHALLDEAMKSDPKDGRAKLLKGQLLLEEGRNDDALANVTAATVAEPSYAPAHFALGKVYAARGDKAGAEKAFREVLRLNPRATAAQVELSNLQLTAARPEESLKTAEAAVQGRPDSFDARVALVRSLLVSKDFTRAEQELNKLLKARPQEATLHVQRGVLSTARGQASAAREYFDRALTLDPKSVEALAGMVALDLQARDMASAKSRIDKRVEAGPVDSQLLLLAARTYATAKDYPAAERVLRRAVAENASLLPAYSMLGQLLLIQRRLDEARAEFDGLAQRESRPTASLTMSGVILQVQGNMALARERFERAVASDPRAGVAANNLAWMYAEAGENLEQAVRLAEAASREMPEVPEVLDTLGYVYYKNDLPALAVPALVRGVEKDPKKAIYHYHLGLAYEKAGDAEKSRQALGRALELDPKFAGADDARQVLARLDERARQQ